jgi:hypothetical protein
MKPASLITSVPVNDFHFTQSITLKPSAMQKRFKSLVILITLIGAVTMGCEKDKEQTRMDLLTSGQWKVISFTLTPPIDIDGDGDVDADAYALMDACQKDDYLVFKRDGKYEANEGLTKCDPLDPQSELLDWSFVNEEKELIMDGDRVTIQELTESRLRLSGNVFGVIAEVTLQK